jgi:hypothetical protein
MARSASDRLALLEQTRDLVEESLRHGRNVIMTSLDGQTTSKEPTLEWLAQLDSRIADLRSQSGTGFAGRKNLVRFTND